MSFFLIFNYKHNLCYPPAAGYTLGHPRMEMQMHMNMNNYESIHSSSGPRQRGNDCVLKIKLI